VTVPPVVEETTTTTVTVPPVVEETTTTTVTVPPVVEETTTTTTEPDPVVDPNDVSTTTTTTTDPSVDPNGEDDQDRCASSRGVNPNTEGCTGEGDPIVDPAVEILVPPTTTTTTTTADPGATVAGGGEQALPAPDQVLGGVVENTMPAPADNPLQSGGSLPRTGQGIGTELTLAFGLVGAGLALLRLARRRRPAAR
jgi:LPXTG-motif cell wall-anchored protein